MTAVAALTAIPVCMMRNRRKQKPKNSRFNWNKKLVSSQSSHCECAGRVHTTQCLIDFFAIVVAATCPMPMPCTQWMCGNFLVAVVVFNFRWPRPGGEQPAHWAHSHTQTIDSMRPIIVFSVLFNRKFCRNSIVTISFLLQRNANRIFCFRRVRARTHAMRVHEWCERAQWRSRMVHKERLIVYVVCVSVCLQVIRWPNKSTQRTEARRTIWSMNLSRQNIYSYAWPAFHRRIETESNGIRCEESLNEVSAPAHSSHVSNLRQLIFTLPSFAQLKWMISNEFGKQ